MSFSLEIYELKIQYIMVKQGQGNRNTFVVVVEKEESLFHTNFEIQICR